MIDTLNKVTPLKLEFSNELQLPACRVNHFKLVYLEYLTSFGQRTEYSLWYMT